MTNQGSIETIGKFGKSTVPVAARRSNSGCLFRAEHNNALTCRDCAMPKRKWSVIRSGLYGLVVQLLAIWLSDWYWGTHDWERITFFLQSGVLRASLVALSSLLPGPVVFILIAGLRNLLARRSAK